MDWYCGTGITAGPSRGDREHNHEMFGLVFSKTTERSG